LFIGLIEGKKQGAWRKEHGVGFVFLNIEPQNIEYRILKGRNWALSGF
jgi:hypothetical protein